MAQGMWEHMNLWVPPNCLFLHNGLLGGGDYYMPTWYLVYGEWEHGVVHIWHRLDAMAAAACTWEWACYLLVERANGWWQMEPIKCV